MLFRRSAANPIMTAADVPYPANSVFNPGAARVGDETLLLARVEDLRGISDCTSRAARDGVTDWRFDPEPLLRSDVEHYPEEIWGCEDPRLTWLPELEEWAIAYTAYSRRGPLVSLATTRDFRTVRRLGPVMPPEDKDAALFPRRFDGRWAMIHRPSPLRGGAHMWLSYSPDLRHWGDHTGSCSRLVTGPGGMRARSASARRRSRRPRAGSSCTTACTPRRTARSIEPDWRCSTSKIPGSSCCRTDEWVFGPAAPYEIIGDVGASSSRAAGCSMTTATGCCVYYGAADQVIGVAEARLSDLLARMTDSPTRTG